MPEINEIRAEINERWQTACRGLDFCHSPNVMLNLIMQGYLDEIRQRGDIESWHITDVYAAFDGTQRIIDHQQIWNLQANIHIQIELPPHISSLLHHCITFSYSSESDPMSKENQIKKAYNDRIAKLKQERLAEKERRELRRKTRWGKICSEVSPNAEEHEQEDGSNTS